MTSPAVPTIFFVVGEESGDQLGSRLMAAITARLGGRVAYEGTGGERMAAAGLTSIFPLHDIAVMGLTAVLARLPTIIRRVHETVDAALAADPAVVVIIDSPDFTHQVAKRIRRRRPDIPIIDYVSPSVWAWRPGRARKMRRYVDHLLALLPFEPEIHRRLGGPPTTYVGHPIADRPELLIPAPGERPALGASPRPRLLILPGSRKGELDRLLGVFGETLGELHRRGVAVDAVIPAVSRHAARIRAAVAGWPVQPEVIEGEAAKFAAFRSAHAALAASGTVSLELAYAGVPMTVAYRLDPLFKIVAAILRRIPGQVNVDSFVLPNIILGERVVPEHLDAEVTPTRLADDLAALLSETPARARQVSAFERLRSMMVLENEKPAAEAAADIVLGLMKR